MSRILLLCALLCCELGFAQTQGKNSQDKTVFLTVDKNNVPVFSDNPSPGATQVKIKETSNSMLPVNPVNLPTPSVDDNPQFKVAFNKPADQETIRENSGTIYVSGLVSPMFAQGLRVQLYLDNKLVAGPTGNANFILHDVDRGEHKLKLELLDRNGKIIAESTEITVFVHRASAISPR